MSSCLKDWEVLADMVAKDKAFAPIVDEEDGYFLIDCGEEGSCPGYPTECEDCCSQ